MQIGSAHIKRIQQHLLEKLDHRRVVNFRITGVAIIKHRHIRTCLVKLEI